MKQIAEKNLYIVTKTKITVCTGVTINKRVTSHTFLKSAIQVGAQPAAPMFNFSLPSESIKLSNVSLEEIRELTASLGYVLPKGFGMVSKSVHANTSELKSRISVRFPTKDNIAGQRFNFSHDGSVAGYHRAKFNAMKLLSWFTTIEDLIPSEKLMEFNTLVKDCPHL